MIEKKQIDKKRKKTKIRQQKQLNTQVSYISNANLSKQNTIKHSKNNNNNKNKNKNAIYSYNKLEKKKKTM